MKKMRSDQFGPYGKLNPTSMTIRTKNGEEIPVTLSASLITIDGKEVGSVGVFTDMRGILKIRKELEDANIQLIQSQKIASIGRMAAGVAHEINNPLSGILIYTELLKENLKDEPEYLKDLEEIIDQTLRCKRIASELLEFSRKSAGKISSFSLDDLISKCLALLINKASFQNITVTTNMDMRDAQPGRRHEPASAGVHQSFHQRCRRDGRERERSRSAQPLTRTVLSSSYGSRTPAREFPRNAGTRSLISSLPQNPREKARDSG